ncbi:uncharacterized protein LOC118146254 [Callithrix jacchus]
MGTPIYGQSGTGHHLEHASEAGSEITEHLSLTLISTESGARGPRPHAVTAAGRTSSGLPGPRPPRVRAELERLTLERSRCLLCRGPAAGRRDLRARGRKERLGPPVTPPPSPPLEPQLPASRPRSEVAPDSQNRRAPPSNGGGLDSALQGPRNALAQPRSAEDPYAGASLTGLRCPPHPLIRLHPASGPAPPLRRAFPSSAPFRAPPPPLTLPGFLLTQVFARPTQ